MRRLPRLACLLAGLAAVTVAAAQPAVPVAPPPRVKRLSEADVARLIARVGSPSFADREAATAELSRRPEAAAAVERARAAATTPEVVRRLGAVSAALKQEWARKRLAKLPDYVRRRQFDRLVETMVLCREHLTAEHDVHVRAFIKQVCEAAIPAGSPWARYRVWEEFESFAWANRVGHQSDLVVPNLVAREAIPLGNRCPVAASDRIAPGRLDDGILRNQLIGCVALCNGDVEAEGIFSGFVLATGPVRVKGLIGGGIVISLAEVEAYGADTCVIVSGGAVPRVEDRKSIVMANAVEFFRTWEMYSERDCGGRIRSLFGGVWVDAVAPDSAFGRAGVRPGERIERIDDAPVHTARDAYRRLCRAAVGTGDVQVVTSQDGRRRELTIGLASW